MKGIKIKIVSRLLFWTTNHSGFPTKAQPYGQGVPLIYIMHGHPMMTSSNGNIFRVTGLLCGNSPVTGEFPAQRPVTRSFDTFFDLRLTKSLIKRSLGWWFGTPSCSLWRRSNVFEFSHTLHDGQWWGYCRPRDDSRRVWVKLQCRPTGTDNIAKAKKKKKRS